MKKSRKKDVIFVRTLSQMEECKRQGYDCNGCEFVLDCEFRTNWTCEGCRKNSSYVKAKSLVFGGRV